MRPRSLTLEGFACFKQPATVSFDGLDLFAIWGATGAGKTTLLDAIVFALFGKVPRLGDRRHHDVISLTRDRAAVRLDFTVGPRAYRVVRTARRTGAPIAKLEDGDGNILADGVRDVDAAIERALGLSYAAFRQSVLLAQGDFARFLKSAPSDRRSIVRDLLHLDVYERMRTTADTRRRDLSVRLTALDQILAEYSDATPERLDELDSALSAARQNHQAARKTLDDVGTRLQDLRIRRGKTVELETLRRHLSELGRAEPRIRSIEARLAASERAMSALPPIARAEDAEAAARKADAARRTADAAVVTQGLRHAEAERESREAVKAADQITPLRDRIRALDGLRGVVDAKRDAVGRLDRAKTAAATADERLRTALLKLKDLKTVATGLAGKLKTAQQALGAVAYDSARDALAQRVVRDAGQLVECRKTLAAATTEVERANKALANARKMLAGNTPAMERAAKAVRRAAELLAEAEAAYQAAHDLHAAAVLRRTLRKGEACPVCEHRVSTIPAKIVVPELDAVTSQRDQAKKADADARAAQQTTAITHARLEAAVTACTTAADSSRSAVETAARAVTEREQAVLATVGTAFERDAGDTIEAKVLAAAARLDQARRAHATQIEVVASLERDHTGAVAAVDGKAREADHLREAATAAAAQVTEITREVAALTSTITAVTTHPDPAAERSEITKTAEELETRLRTAATAQADAAARLEVAKGMAASAAETADQAAKTAAELRQSADTAARNAHFDSPAAVRAAVLTAPDVAAQRETVRAYQRDRDTTEQGIEKLAGEPGDGLVSEEQLTETTAAHEQARIADDTALRALTDLEGTLRRSTERLEKRAGLDRQRAMLAAEYEVYRSLADDLRTDRFQDFVLEESFHDLARGASQRLDELTGRYALRYEGGNILVVDHDNADETRSADTLSGGETFLASLALALQLSEQIQQAAGAVLLESLFIDEGFGTLDREALESAASAIESLGGGGRMVGIITHIRELADRLPCRIEVNSHTDGSRVETYRP